MLPKRCLSRLIILITPTIPIQLTLAATLHVPADYQTIQSCINAAVSGQDECVVAPGAYNELINFLGKAITLRSSHDPAVTIIDGASLNGSIVSCASGESLDTVLDGFSITGGTGKTIDPGYTAGGGMLNAGSSPTVTNCTFSGNAATYGGGMLNGGGNPTVTNCTFSGNTSRDGGGMYNTSSNPTVSNCTFSGNTAEYGSGMYNYSSSPTLADSIIWGDSSVEIYNTGASTPSIHYSEVQGGLPVGAVDGGGNLNLDPLFVRSPNPGPDGNWGGVDDDFGDLRLQLGSPCINVADPDFAPAPGETDLDGHARVLCGRVDMGAYEFGIGDFNCDQVVNLADFAAWELCMSDPVDLPSLQPPPLKGEGVGPHADPPMSPSPRRVFDLIKEAGSGCEAFDFDADSDVDLFDFAKFQQIVEQ